MKLLETICGIYVVNPCKNFCLDERLWNRSYVMVPPVGYVITKFKTLVTIIEVQISINYKNALRKLY